jgi:hypothetical protein
MKKTRKITKADKEAADRLKNLWRLRKKPLGLTQEKVAALWGGHGEPKTQGLISQYLNGTIVLGPVAVMKWARILKVRPTDIRQDFEYKDMVSGDLRPDAIEIAIKWQSLPPRSAIDFKSMLDTMIGHIQGYEDFLGGVTADKNPQKLITQ